MNIEIIKDDKNDMELMIDNITIAEILRVYLNEEGIDFVAWRREHPSKPALFKIKSSGKTVSKAVSDASAAIMKDLEDMGKLVKKG